MDHWVIHRVLYQGNLTSISINMVAMFLFQYSVFSILFQCCYVSVSVYSVWKQLLLSYHFPSGLLHPGHMKIQYVDLPVECNIVLFYVRVLDTYFVVHRM